MYTTRVSNDTETRTIARTFGLQEAIGASYDAMRVEHIPNQYVDVWVEDERGMCKAAWVILPTGFVEDVLVENEPAFLV